MPCDRTDPLTPIDLVPEDGMVDALKMGPYLVRTACVRTEHDARRRFAKGFFDSIVCDRTLRLKRLG